MLKKGEGCISGEIITNETVEREIETFEFLVFGDEAPLSKYRKILDSIINELK